MSKQPVMAPTPAFIFKDLRLRGFWLSGLFQPLHEHCQDNMPKACKKVSTVFSIQCFHGLCLQACTTLMKRYLSLLAQRQQWIAEMMVDVPPAPGS